MLTGDVPGDRGHSKVGFRAACFPLWKEPDRPRRLWARGNTIFPQNITWTKRSRTAAKGPISALCELKLRHDVSLCAHDQANNQEMKEQRNP